MNEKTFTTTLDEGMQEQNARNRGCSVCHILGSFTDDEVDYFNMNLKGGRLQAKTAVAALLTHGHRTSESTVRRHRERCL